MTLLKGSTTFCESVSDTTVDAMPVGTTLRLIENPRLPDAGWIAEEMGSLMQDYRLRYAVGLLNETLITRLEATPGWSWTL